MKDKIKSKVKQEANKRWIVISVAALLAIALVVGLVLILGGQTNLDSAAKKLADAGYTVTRLGEGADGVYADAADEDVAATVSATAGPNGEWLTIIKFHDKNVAEEFYRLQRNAYETSYFMTVKLDGHTVIYGWTTAYNLIK